MKAGLDYFRSRKYVYFLTFYSANNTDAEIMLRPNIHSVRDARRATVSFLSAFAGIYYRFWLTGCEFIHKSLNHYYKNTQGHINTIYECQLAYFCIFSKPIVVLFVFKNI